MKIPQQLDLACKLGEHWPLVVEAYTAGLPTLFPLQNVPRIGVLDADLRVAECFRKVVVEVAGGRDIGALHAADLRTIASRYGH